MAVNLSPPDKHALLPVAGIRLAVASAGIKTPGRKDVVLIEMAEGSHCAAVYTRNAFCAAPVIVAREHQQQATPRFLLVNSGNANAGTGDQGLAAARQCCGAVATHGHVLPQQVLPFSTGVIGQQLPVAKIEQALPSAFDNLSADGWFDAAYGIMTTDTVAKATSEHVLIDGREVTVTGISKGAGMIRPDMATMLAYIATDAAIAPELLQPLLNDVMNESFNRISVDGDTSTNDACVLMATGQAANTLIDNSHSAQYQQLADAVAKVCRYLAQAIVRDGEGATKFISIVVEQGKTSDECCQVAYTIAHSPLVKTALFASDPNWGRILACVGRSGLVELDLSKISIFLDDVCVIEAGQPALDYTEDKGQQVMNNAEISIRVLLGRGAASETVWTCDFSYDYVKINAEYRT
ncbi:bifunctional ornithine acetyltransferase/N-acetylglutamate synthase protein [Methylophaga lonarensis MPL]|uniref:Arginine biosynthesis bifunctional protein ArgJ n=1 Tax=Methylophaga lonarensis MPL TaxID=1286106 RepID=M7PSF0_9GAMM|nr:bifunctional glutamate N-acetyltransferase/amino-acid acetyltransferase ArgJ [Methylophaga lonarensis]EMR13354.1 bifunctional ornithine acetyltransferase/N-acetylglutamate synthase protein [Methylophaga lonarensis MPL]